MWCLFHLCKTAHRKHLLRSRRLAEVSEPIFRRIIQETHSTWILSLQILRGTAERSLRSERFHRRNGCCAASRYHSREKCRDRKCCGCDGKGYRIPTRNAVELGRDEAACANGQRHAENQSSQHALRRSGQHHLHHV